MFIVISSILFYENRNIWKYIYSTVKDCCVELCWMVYYNDFWKFSGESAFGSRIFFCILLWREPITFLGLSDSITSSELPGVESWSIVICASFADAHSVSKSEGRWFESRFFKSPGSFPKISILRFPSWDDDAKLRYIVSRFFDDLGWPRMTSNDLEWPWD